MLAKGNRDFNTRCDNLIHHVAVMEQLLQDHEAAAEWESFNLTKDGGNPRDIPKLFDVLNSSDNSKVRQYATVLLKDLLLKNAEHWIHLPQHEKIDYKRIVLKKLFKQDVSLQCSIVDLIITIANHEFTDLSTKWPELFECIQKLLDVESFSDNQVGISLISAISAKRLEILVSQKELVLSFLTKTPHNFEESNQAAIYNILLTTLRLVPAIEDDNDIRIVFHEALPQLICSVQALAELNEHQATEILQLLDEFSRNNPDVITAYTVILITTCIRIAENILLDNSLRVRALRIVKWLSEIRNRTIQNNELLRPIVDMIHTVMCEPVQGELGDFYLNALTNNSTPITCAMQILNVLSQHPSAQALASLMLRPRESVIEKSNIYVRRGSYLAMAVIAEHCVQFIDKESFEIFMKYIRPSLTDTTPIIRNAVQFTLGKIGRHIYTYIFNYADELLPILDDYLKSACKNIKEDNDLSTLDTLFYMLEEFYYEFDAMTIPYLPALMCYLFGILETNTSDHVKKLALKGFISATNGTHEKMFAYFPRLISMMESWLDEKQIEVTADFQAQVFFTLSEIGWRISKEYIAPVAERFLEIAVRILKHTTNPILKRDIYNYIALTCHPNPAPIVTMLKVEPHVLDNMIKSVQFIDRQSSDTIDAPEHVKDYVKNVNNPYLEEKNMAITALGLLAFNIGEPMFTYIEKSYQEVLKCIDCPVQNISTTSLSTSVWFLQVLSEIQSTESDQIKQNMVDILIPTLLKTIYDSNDSDLIVGALHTYADILRVMKRGTSIEEKHKEPTINCIINVLSGNSICKNQKETRTSSDEIVMSSARTMLGNLRKVLQPNEFLAAFELALPILNSITEESDIKARCHRIDAISLCLRGLGPAVTKFVPQFVPLLLKTISDPNATMRGYGCTAIARIVRYGGDALNSYYPEMLKALLAAISIETDLVIRDNMISCIGSLIWTNYSLLPIEEFFPVFVNYLPLKVDTEEFRAVFGGILALSRDHHAVLETHMQALLKIAVHILHTNMPLDHKEIKEFVTEFLRIVQQDYPSEWNNLETILSPEELTFVQQHFSQR